MIFIKDNEKISNSFILAFRGRPRRRGRVRNKQTELLEAPFCTLYIIHLILFSHYLQRPFICRDNFPHFPLAFPEGGQWFPGSHVFEFQVLFFFLPKKSTFFLGPRLILKWTLFDHWVVISAFSALILWRFLEKIWSLWKILPQDLVCGNEILDIYFFVVFFSSVIVLISTYCKSTVSKIF